MENTTTIIPTTATPTTITVNVQSDTFIKATGELHSGNCDPVIIIETGEAFTSQTDCAKHLGVSSNAVSAVICGRSRTCKGYHIVSVSRLPEETDMILTRLRETSKMEEAALKWYAYEAEQARVKREEEERLERERIEKEKHEAQVAKAKDSILRCRRICKRAEDVWANAMKREQAAEDKYKELTGHLLDEESEMATA